MRLSLTIALVLLVFKPTFLMAVHLGSSPFDVDESPAAPETASCDLSSTLFESGFSPTSMNFGSLGVPPSEAECSLVKQRIRDSKDVGEVLSSVTDGKFTPDDSFLERSMKVYQKYDLLDPEGTTKVTEPMIKEFLTVAAKVDPTEPVVKKVEELVKEKEKRTAPATEPAKIPLGVGQAPKAPARDGVVPKLAESPTPNGVAPKLAVSPVFSGSGAPVPPVNFPGGSQLPVVGPKITATAPVPPISIPKMPDLKIQPVANSPVPFLGKSIAKQEKEIPGKATSPFLDLLGKKGIERSIQEGGVNDLEPARPLTSLKSPSLANEEKNLQPKVEPKVSAISIQLPVLNYSNGETPQEELSKKSLPVEKTPSKITPGYESTQFALGNSLATQGETVAVLDKPGTAKERLSSKPKSIVSEFLSFLGGGKTGKASETSRTPTSVSSKFHSELLGLQGAGGVQEAPVFFGADRTGVSWTLLFWGFFGTLCTLWGLRLNRVSRRRVTGKGTALVVSEKRYRDLN